MQVLPVIRDLVVVQANRQNLLHLAWQLRRQGGKALELAVARHGLSMLGAVQLMAASLLSATKAANDEAESPAPGREEV